MENSTSWHQVSEARSVVDPDEDLEAADARIGEVPDRELGRVRIEASVGVDHDDHDALARPARPAAGREQLVEVPPRVVERRRLALLARRAARA